MMRPSLPDLAGLPEVNFPHFSKPWFSYVPKGVNESTHPEWFGQSLVHMIRRAKPEQEIGFHSFSHVLFTQPGITRERAIAEYQYCAQIARELGIPTTSFVYPRNLVAYVAERRDARVTCFCDVDDLSIRCARGMLTFVATIL